MTWHMQDGHLGARHVAPCSLLKQTVADKGFDLQGEPLAEKEVRVGHHRRRIGMVGNFALVATLDLGGIRHMVEVPVGQKEPVNFLPSELSIRTFRRIKKDVSRGALEKKRVRIQRASCKGFELFCHNVVRLCMSLFDFLPVLCKVFAPSRMKFFKITPLALFAASLLVPFIPSAATAAPDEGQVSIAVARWLEQAHFTRKKLDDKMAAKLLQTYLELLDYNRLYFTQKDIAEFQSKYDSTLDDLVMSGDLSPAHVIFERFKSRVEERAAKNQELAKKTYDFNTDRTVELNRQKAPWPKDNAEADRLWRDRVEAELLQETLSEVKTRPPAERVAKRYDQMLRSVKEMQDDGVMKSFLNALAQTYDPHSEYFSPSDMENFNIAMRLSLVGVGAVLRTDDGFARIMELVPGGPADRDGRLKVNDRVAAVAQGNGEFEDVVDMKLDKVVEKIRGKKGTVVRLQVIPSDSPDGAKRQIIEITRDQVKLKDQEAKAEVLDVKGEDGATNRIGWITLPSFYNNMGSGGPEKSTTEDVAALLGRLKQEGIEGLVIDLRKDGGGSLEEAINLTGLFIPKGPVVQSKDPNGKITVSSDSNPSVAYTGPVIVVMNRLSASASEIFAAALQDYGRAVIVGDKQSFGKGTVQTVLDIGKVMPFFSLGAADAGSLKLTIQKFYRVRGGSTQLQGVASDLVLPSRTDNPELGEGSLRNRLEYDEVAPQKIVASSHNLFLDDLRQRSSARIASDPEFRYISQDMTRLTERLASNRLSLNKDTRQKEISDEKKLREERIVERSSRGPIINAQVWQVTLDDVRSNREKLEEVAYERHREKQLSMDDPEADDEQKAVKKAPEPDPVRNETLRVTQDLINLGKLNKTVSVTPAAAAQIP